MLLLSQRLVNESEYSEALLSTSALLILTLSRSVAEHRLSVCLSIRVICEGIYGKLACPCPCTRHTACPLRCRPIRHDPHLPYPSCTHRRTLVPTSLADWSSSSTAFPGGSANQVREALLFGHTSTVPENI